MISIWRLVSVPEVFIACGAAKLRKAQRRAPPPSLRIAAALATSIFPMAGFAPLAVIKILSDYPSMRRIFPLLLVMPGAASAADHPRTYLLSVIGLPVKPTVSVTAFSFETWGVEFNAVCSIPSGWRIKAGSSATPNGELGGEGSQGATWFNQRNPKGLKDFVLVTLYAPVQRADVKTENGSGLVPATFKGFATLETDDGDRRVPLTFRNVMLTPSRACPSR